MSAHFLTICALVPILATMLGVEDTDGGVSIVLVHNFPFLSQSTLAGVDIVFPLGKHLLIREPSYMLTESAQSAYIRVYSPTDIIFLEDDDPICTTSNGNPYSIILSHSQRLSTVGGSRVIPNSKKNNGSQLRSVSRML